MQGRVGASEKHDYAFGCIPTRVLEILVFIAFEHIFGDNWAGFSEVSMIFRSSSKVWDTKCMLCAKFGSEVSSKPPLKPRQLELTLVVHPMVVWVWFVVHGLGGWGSKFPPYHFSRFLVFSRFTAPFHPQPPFFITPLFPFLCHFFPQV